MNSKRAARTLRAIDDGDLASARGGYEPQRIQSFYTQPNLVWVRIPNKGYVVVSNGYIDVDGDPLV